jgi:hypothetical protein
MCMQYWVITYQPTSKQKLMTMFELTENDIKQIYKLPFKTKKIVNFSGYNIELTISDWLQTPFYIRSK